MRRALIVGAVALASFAGVSTASANTIKLGFALDNSGSISNSEYNLMKNGLNSALNGIPTDGTYEIAVVTFNSSVTPIVSPPLVINSAADIATVQAAITGAANSSGLTAIGSGIQALVDIFGNIGDDQGIINVSTDGNQNTGLALNTAAANAAAAGFDGLSFEAIGNGVSLGPLSNVAFPGPVTTIANFDPNTDTIPNALTGGFVVGVNSFADYEAVINAKVQAIVNPVPIPAALPLLLTGFAIVGFVGRRRKAA